MRGGDGGDEAELAREFATVKVLNVSGPVKQKDYPPHVRYEHAELPGDPVAERLGHLSDPGRDKDYDARLVRAVLELGGSCTAHDPAHVLAEGSENLVRVRKFLAAA